MAEAVEQYDVFVSYRRVEPDASWVRTVLVPGLRAAGLRVFLDDDDFVLGEPLLREMARAVESSRYTVAVLTPRYAAGAFAELENLMARHLGLERARRRLLGVLREPTLAQPGLRVTRLLDLTDDARFADQLEVLIRSVQPHDDPGNA